MIVLLGLVSRNHSVLLLGATVVVLLNIGRVLAGLANLAAIAFRDGVIQGLLFLIPPITFVYLAQHWQKVQKPVKRVVGPILTILLAIAAVSFEPMLRGGGKAEGATAKQGATTKKGATMKKGASARKSSDQDEFRAGAESVEKAILGGIEKASKLKPTTSREADDAPAR
jgi:hypothetical protein